MFQRGEVDGLNMIVLHVDDDYYLSRQSLAIPHPGEADGSAIDLDGFFGLHSSISALKSSYNAGDLAAIYATGTLYVTYSHHDAMDFMERAFLEKGGIFTGWLGRHLESFMNASSAPLRAVGMDKATPISFANSLSGRPGPGRITLGLSSLEH